MNELSFPSAVLKIINEFRSNKQNFSAYDVTSRLRTQVNNQEFGIKYAQQEHIDSIATYRIDHEVVRSFISELYSNNLLTGYTRHVEMSQGRNSFMLYKYEDNDFIQTPVGTTTTVSSPVSVKFSLPNHPKLPTVTQQQVQKQKPPINSFALTARITSYITGKYSRGQRPTLKSIQSTLKNYSISTETIKRLVVEKGYKVTPVQGVKPSLSLVEY